MEILHSKMISSEKLKSSLDKSLSILQASEFSRSICISGGGTLNCPICRHQESTCLVNIYGFEWKECTECGVAYVCNPPDENVLAAAYSSEYYTAANKILYANDEIIEYRVEEIAKPKVDFVVKRLTTKKRTWLDIGCGVGEILGVAKTYGFTTLGLEANLMEAEYAKKHFGVDVRQEYLSSNTLDFFANSYGVVSLFSVLEHMLDPISMLKSVSKIQGIGDNVVIEVPHYPSLSALSQMTFPEHVNRIMHPPFHLFLFSIKALTLMLHNIGYRIRSLWLFGQDIYEVFSTLGLHTKEFSGSVLQKKISLLEYDFQCVVDNNDLSDELLLVAEKTI